MVVGDVNSVVTTMESSSVESVVTFSVDVVFDVVVLEAAVIGIVSFDVSDSLHS